MSYETMDKVNRRRKTLYAGGVLPGRAGVPPRPITDGTKPWGGGRELQSGQSYDAVIIGGGHNGLIAAAYLARARKSVLVLERRHVVGGAAVTEEVFPGFKFTVCSYVCSMLRPAVIRELELPKFGLTVIPQECNFIPSRDGRYLYFRGDEEDTHNAVLAFSKHDAEALPRYDALMVRLCKFIQPLLDMAPPDIASFN